MAPVHEIVERHCFVQRFVQTLCDVRYLHQITEFGVDPGLSVRMVIKPKDRKEKSKERISRDVFVGEAKFRCRFPRSGCPCAHQFLNHAGVFGQLILSKIPSDLPHPSPAHQQSTEPCCPAFAKYPSPLRRPSHAQGFGISA